MTWYQEVLKKYAVFSGRAGRREYWYFFLCNLLISFGLAVIDGILNSLVQGIGVLGVIYSLAVFVPSLAVAVRRLHDTGRSGWFLLLGLIPLIGAIIVIVFLASKGDPDTNKYGSRVDKSV
ncbi:MAG: DUF805 domain-containing protein [Cyanobacteriota bacterium]|nr:DUF805 domain-containing protein [Cyanobacteriota bacterium]